MQWHEGLSKIVNIQQMIVLGPNQSRCTLIKIIMKNGYVKRKVREFQGVFEYQIPRAQNTKKTKWFWQKAVDVAPLLCKYDMNQQVYRRLHTLF